MYSDLEKGANSDYWNDITIITEEELKKLQMKDKNSRGNFKSKKALISIYLIKIELIEHAGDRREGINQSVLQDVSSLFKNKTYNELIELEKNIKRKIDSEVGIDIGYWESLLSQLKAHMARARLKERHQKLLHEKLDKLKKEV